MIGKILNTNAQWLAKRITVLGLSVRRITTVGDNADEISAAVKEALKRDPSFLIITGGLGPTFDDKTLEGVAKALGSELVTNEEALNMVKERVRSYVSEGRIADFELTSYIVKMAKLPREANPIGNPVGTAPAVLIKHDKSVLIVLPGVPKEVMGIFNESVVPLLRKIAGDAVFFETTLNVQNIGESELAPMITQVMHDNPKVYVKSHPKDAEKILAIELHLSTTAHDIGTAQERVTQVVAQISKLITEKGGEIKKTYR